MKGCAGRKGGPGEPDRLKGPAKGTGDPLVTTTVQAPAGKPAPDLRGRAPTAEEGGYIRRDLNPNPQAPEGEMKDLRGIGPSGELEGRSGMALILPPPIDQ